MKCDFPAILDYITGLDGWKPTTGPDHGDGEDFYYQTEDGKYQAHIVLDRTWLSVDIDDNLQYSGDIADDTGLHPFIEGEIPQEDENDSPEEVPDD